MTEENIKKEIIQLVERLLALKNKKYKNIEISVHYITENGNQGRLTITKSENLCGD